MPGGRPSKINTVVLTRTTDDGTTIEVTAGERIVQALRMGNYVETAAALAGVDKATVYEWLKVGAQATDKHQRQGIALAKLTTHERRCMEFSHAVAEAQALSEADDVATTAELAQGGRQHTTTTTKRDAEGKVLEHTTRVETLQPNPAVLTWRLERRFPERWGRRRIEVSGPDGEAIPIEARVVGIVAAARAFHGDTGPGARADEALDVGGSEDVEANEMDDDHG